MANYPKKMVDPTEAALSAIQEALNIKDEEIRPEDQSDTIAVAPPTPDQFMRETEPATPAFERRFHSRADRQPRRRATAATRRQRRPAVRRPGSPCVTTPPGPHLLFRRRIVFRRVDCRLPGIILGLSVRIERVARARPFASRSHDRSWRCGSAAHHLLLRRGTHRLALTGIAPDYAGYGSGRTAPVGA